MEAVPEIKLVVAREQILLAPYDLESEALELLGDGSGTTREFRWAQGSKMWELLTVGDTDDRLGVMVPAVDTQEAAVGGAEAVSLREGATAYLVKLGYSSENGLPLCQITKPHLVPLATGSRSGSSYVEPGDGQWKEVTPGTFEVRPINVVVGDGDALVPTQGTCYVFEALRGARTFTPVPSRRANPTRQVRLTWRS